MPSRLSREACVATRCRMAAYPSHVDCRGAQGESERGDECEGQETQEVREAMAAGACARGRNAGGCRAQKEAAKLQPVSKLYTVMLG